jgi:hypothetical protein
MQQESPKDMRWFILETLWRSIPLILPGVILKQFTARDIISKWDVIEVRSSATAKTAEEFLCTLRDRTPFSIRAIQVDGGGEFYAQFESACRERGILLFVLPPKSPKLNGYACLLQTGGESKQNPY